jgi:DNA invertase Pin-like site-specific DNA recombinase
MRIAIYARESSDDLSKAPPITEQIERGRAWARENGHEVVEVYADDGYSGGNWKRPAWLQCVKDAKRHHYAVLWVWNQDRLARDTEQFLWFCRMLRSGHVKIYEDTANEHIDMDSLGGRVKHQTMAQAAEIFRLVTSDKVKKAYERNKRAGKPWGRPKKHFDLQRAIMLHNQGKGWRTIGKEVGVSYQTIRRTFISIKHRVDPEEGKK